MYVIIARNHSSSPFTCSFDGKQPMIVSVTRNMRQLSAGNLNLLDFACSNGGLEWTAQTKHDRKRLSLCSLSKSHVHHSELP